MNSVHFSTGKDDWGTPQDLFDALNEEFNFTLDPCADNNNHKCAKYYTIEQDGLAQSWAGETVFCNPPYSRKTKTNAGQIAWVQKCYKEATEGGIVVVMLIPARTDTIMFHDYILGKAEIRFIKGRVNFEIDGQKSKDPAPFPSMIVKAHNVEYDKKNKLLTRSMNDAILSEPNSFGEIKIDKMLQKVRIDPCDAIIDAHKLAMGVEVEEITTDQSIEAYLKMFEKAGVKED